MDAMSTHMVRLADVMKIMAGHWKRRYTLYIIHMGVNETEQKLKKIK